MDLVKAPLIKELNNRLSVLRSTQQISSDRVRVILQFDAHMSRIPYRLCPHQYFILEEHSAVYSQENSSVLNSQEMQM
jgi:hypothetical protein